MLFHIHAKELDLSFIRLDYAQQGIYGRGLSCAVLPYKTHYASLRYRKAYVIQSKTVISFDKSFYLYSIFEIHIIPPHLNHAYCIYRIYTL